MAYPILSAVQSSLCCPSVSQSVRPGREGARGHDMTGSANEALCLLRARTSTTSWPCRGRRARRRSRTWKPRRQRAAWRSMRTYRRRSGCMGATGTQGNSRGSQGLSWGTQGDQYGWLARGAAHEWRSYRIGRDPNVASSRDVRWEIRAVNVHGEDGGEVAGGWQGGPAELEGG
jgi:hypothetical protein